MDLCAIGRGASGVAMEQVLVTGFPGFLAERLVARCQRERGKVFWHFVVLQEEVAGASRKLQALGLPLSECALYPGDVTKPDLGLSTEDADTLRQSVERCFHFAALDDLTASPALSDAVNVWGARRVIAFLKQCPNLRKFNFVSTCYVSGLIEGDVREDELVSPPGFRNEYERTKYEAEAVVRESMGELPTTIFRPAAVVGDSQTGDTSKFDGPYTLILFFRWAHRLSYWMPNLGFGDAHFNCVPVDFVTEVLARVGFSEHYPGATLHVADPVPPTTSEAFALIYQQITGRTCIELKDATKRLVLRVLRYFPVDLVTGIPAQTLDYFEHRGNYATRNLENACEEFDIAIPKWSEFYKPVIKFALTEDRHMPNAAVVREFKAWCMGFRLIYAALGLLLIFAPRFVTGVVTLLDDQAVAADLM
ncbi:MAG: hypothetical protein QG656_2248, partial [Candidatus Hydrogenedentes bacterium]|nr:hypothetical protein [Candidatus Hydrogenedentota bacterium]